MTERGQRIVAWVITLAVHVVVLTYLTHSRHPKLSVAPEPEHVVQLVFIEKPAPTLPAVKASEPARKSMQSPAKPSGTVTPLAPRLPPQPAIANPKGLQVVTVPENQAVQAGNDVWTQNAAAPSGQPITTTDYRPNPLARRPVPMTASVDRMRLRMRDRSIGGRLQEMTKASICKDLRRALSNSPASAMAILASMEENDCNK